MDTLGIVHANRISMCLTHIRVKGETGTVKTNLSSSVLFLLTIARRSLFFRVCFCCFCLSLQYFHFCFLQPWGHLVGKG